MSSVVLKGFVVSDKCDKTVVVKVQRVFNHKKYKKIVRSYKKYYAHDEKNAFKIGDLIMIRSSRPLSALKRWIVIY